MSRKHTGSRLAAQLIVLLLTALFFTSPVWAQNLEINVETSRGGELSGVKVYAFTESGSYTGKYATTDGSGTALFDLEDFADGTYKFRVDYLGSQFWSQVIPIPGATVVEVVIEEETVEVTVTTGSGPAEGVRGYLFSESGSYLGIYEVTDAAGMVYFDLPVGKNFKFRADILGGQYWSDVITVSSGGMNSVSVNAGGGFFQVTVEKALGSPMEGIKVYLFSQSGSYLGLYEVTNASGIVGFNVPEGTYKVRADYLGYQFWSEEAQVIGDTGMVLTIPHQQVEVTVQGLFAGVPEPIVGINVYLFNPAGSYLGQYQQTNSSGKVTFELPEKAYKVRADYLGQQFWSEAFTWQDTAVNVPMADAEITVTGAGFPEQGVKVYLFSAAGSYLGLNETTDIDGKVAFRVPEGAYKLRVDYQGSQYWSPEETLAADQVNYITISVGGGSFTVTIQTGTAEPIVGVKCYVFNESGTYLGLFGATDSNGDVSFDLADGTYKFRADYQGSQFWSEVATVPDVSATDVTIEEETVEVMVTTAAGPAEGIRVYLFSESGSYLGIYEVTDENGLVSFDLPVGNAFKFRADILGNQYWSDVITVSGGGVNNVSVNAGGGLLQVTVEKAPGSPMEGIKVYLFSQTGSYLGLYEVTDASGVVGFHVSQGTFKVRADYLGYQFWSTETQVTGDTNIVLTIPHQQVGVTVQGVFQGAPEPIEGIKVYLFSSAGSYLGQYQQTDSNGKVTFDLPEKAYKVRADYLGQQFWSEEFTWQDTTVEVPMADAEITVTGAGLPQEGVKVYVFSAAGSYLGLYDTTDNDGKVTFRIPEGAYKFRADEGGGQYWSAVIDIVAGQVNSVAIEIDVLPVTVNISADPETILLGESSTLTWSSADADSCVIEPGIGSVDVTGSISVSPIETTTYTITATGPGGTASATVTVTVTYLAPSVGISAYPETILLGESSTLSWSSADADTCVIDPDIGSVDVTGSISVSPTGTTTYTITATGTGGTATAVVTVTVTYPQPTVSISANPGTILQGGSSTLTWTSTGADSATIDQGIGTVEPSGSTTVSPAETTTYTITVTGPGGTTSANATITVTYPAPSVGISADPETIQVGESSTLTWSSTHADSATIDPGIGTVEPSGSTTVSPTETTTYTITATGPGGTATASVTITVTSPTPTVTISADLETIQPGGSSTLTWTSTNADTCMIDPDIGSVDVTGSISVSPTETTTYTITATGPGGTATSDVTVTVTYPVPSVSISADPDTILLGEYSTLTWSSADADSCVIEPDIGSVDVNGSTAVSPTETTTYTITATGPGGTTTANATVTVNYPPSITVVEPDGVDDTADTTFTIQWSDADPDDDATISLYYDTDNSGADGTLIVSGLAEDPDGPDDAFEWDISELDVGTYYVYAQIDDGINAPVIDYSDGVISVPVPGNKIYAADGANGDMFGLSVSISGEYAIVSAPSADSVMPNWGAAYVFKKDDVGWIEQAKLVWGGDDNFGCSVSISGDYAIVGADEYSIKRGTARIYSRDGSSWTTEATLLASDGGTNDHFGTSVSISGDYAIVGAPDNSYPTGAAYVFKKEGSTWVQTDKLMPQGVEIGENDFGQTVSINGDYAIVGNRWDGYWDVPANTVFSGCAYIFKREGEDWVQQCRLASFDLSGTPRSIEDSFATFVSINTNYAIVGAYHDDSSGTDAGAAYIYQLEDGVWTEQIKLTALNASPGDRFGITVSVSNSYAVVGSRYAAYIYENNGSTWVLHAQIKKDPLSSTSYFGSYTALDDQFVLLGVPGDSGNEDGSGAGYIYSIDNLEAWPIIAILKPSINHYADNQFTIQWIDFDPDDNADISIYYDMDNSGADGTLIANGISEDPDEPEDDAYVWQTTGLAEGIYYVYAIIDDGVHDPVVDYGDGTVTISHTPSYEIKLTSGAPGGYDWFGGSVSISGDYAIAGACGKNAAYILRRDGSIWTEQTKLTATDAAAGDKFGYSVSISGDYAIVGAYLDDDAGRDSGSAYIFKRDGEVWTEQVKLTASDAYAYDKFGYSVSISGDYAIVGAHRNDDAGTDSGSAYIFKRDGEIWTQQAKLTANDASDRYFGSAVSISEEYAIVGAFCQYDVESTGSAYIFKRNDSNWTQQAKLIASDAAAYDYFGGAVSISGEYAIVGARYDDDDGSGSGSAYIFKREGSNWNEKTKITANDAVAGDYFGYSVTISGDYIIVSARGDDDGGNSSGSAYIFKHYGSAWIQEAKITASDAAEYDYFGHSVSLNGGYAIIGAQGDDNNTGSVYIYSITTVNFSADPETIQVGESSTLAWSSTHADSCVIEPGIGGVDPNGSTMVSPTETTTYTIMATGIGGTSTANVTVTVTAPEPTVSIAADPASIPEGESSTLTWTSTHADSAIIDNGIGSVDVNGSITVSPNETTMYTITATGIGGTSTDSVTVSVSNPAPAVSIKAVPVSIQSGQSSTLTWSSSYADSVIIDQDIGSVVLEGSITVSPTVTTTYTITGTGPWGTATASVKLYVSANGYAYGDPTPAEQAHLEAINRARLNPAGEAARLGIDLNEGLPPGTISEDPKQPLPFNAQLLQAARLHSRDMIDQQYYGHNSFDGRTPADRIQEAGYQFIYEGENIGYRVSTATLDEVDTILGFHDSLFIDAGVGGRGHRKNILNNSFEEVGLGVAPGSYDGYPYCYMFTCDFASSSTLLDSFLLGVVYDDQNSDGIYTAGEGIGNVGIVIIESGAYTSTASAGGYGLPLPLGEYTVVATLPDGRGVTRQISISDQNVKVDFLLSEFNAQQQPAVTINADPVAILTGESSTLSWVSTYANSCVIEPGIGSVDVNGSITASPTETTTYAITAMGPGGTVTDTVTVTVTESSAPTVSISAEPGTINVGEFSTLMWSSSNATAASIDQSIGSVDVNGLIIVFPTETTTYTITVTGPGGTATDNATVTVTILMSTVEGTVTDATTGQSIEEVLVSVTDSQTTQTTHTGATGEYQIEGIRPGAITVTFTKDEYVPVEKNLSIAADETLTLNISLYEILPGATLIGTVKDKITGQPLQGATVSAKDSDKTQSVQTLEDGSYTITGITPCIVEITATLTGYFPETGQFDLPAEQFYTLDLELYSESTLVTVYGTITNSTTLQPEPGVSITVEGTDISDVTLENGTFTLEDVPMGEQSLKVVKEDFCYFIQPVKINQDPFEVNLIFPLIPVSPYPAEIDTTITGYVHDAVSGQGLNGAIVRIYGTSIQATTDHDGQYTLTDLPAGAITVIAMALNHEAVLVSPTVVPGASDTFQFNLPPTTKGVITGTITNADTGEPIRHARILIGENSLLATESEADGTYTLVGTPGGSYSVTAMHPEYVTAESDPIVVEDAMTTIVDFTLTHRPETGDLEGSITDKDTDDPIIDATLTVQGTSITTSTDSNGYYELSDLPAGLVTIAIDADGYPSTTRTTAVVAHEDDATLTTTIFEIELDALDHTPPDSISELIIAEDGGSIVSPDSRFMMVIPPEALSGDAIVTLMSPTDGPEVYPGDDLALDHGLGLSDIKALGRMTQVVVEPATAGEEIPTIQGWVLISGRYFQSEVDGFNIAENSIFPYYWDGTQWTIMRVKAYEMAVDRINNMPVMVVDFSTTATGNPVTAQLGTREPVLLASLDDHIPDITWAKIYKFIWAGACKMIYPAEPNVKIMDKDELAAAVNAAERQKPNANALPLLIIHGWDPWTIIKNKDLTDPNTHERYSLIVQDLVNATNGVYRPMFIMHNSRAGMTSIGNDLACKLDPSQIKGTPNEQGNETSGMFPFFDAFGFSMGGLIARDYQARTGQVHNMVLAGTPNHGTLNLINYLVNLYMLGDLIEGIKKWSPGTEDLIDYNDRDSLSESTNPCLHLLNQNSASTPSDDMTLIAGTDSSKTVGLLLPKPNDSVVPVDSVFCRTSYLGDDLKSLLNIRRPNEKYEYTFGFNHDNFGGRDFKIEDNLELEKAITHGLSDWSVSKLISQQVDMYPQSTAIRYAEFEVDVEFNTFEPNDQDIRHNRDVRDRNRILLVIYGKDRSGGWHIASTYTDNEGKITFSESIEGNSIEKHLDEPLRLSCNASFDKEDDIIQICFSVVPVKRDPDTLEYIPEKVPATPGGNFGIPRQ